jgi:hypothetical protein
MSHLVPRLSLFCLLAIIAIVGPARADYITYQLNATPNSIGITNNYGAFSVVYVDIDRSGRLSVVGDTLLYFSGLAVTGYPLFNVLGGAAGYNDTLYTDEIGTGADPSWRSWGFGTNPNTFAMTAPAFCWNYQQSAVPLPSSAFLLAAGLIPLAWARRKRWLDK